MNKKDTGWYGEDDWRVSLVMALLMGSMMLAVVLLMKQ